MHSALYKMSLQRRIGERRHGGADDSNPVKDWNHCWLAAGKAIRKMWFDKNRISVGWDHRNQSPARWTVFRAVEGAEETFDSLEWEILTALSFSVWLAG